MYRGLKARIILAFTTLLILSAISFTLAFNLGLDNLFQNYANLQQERRINQILSQVNSLYLPQSDSFNTQALEAVGNAALQNGLILHIETVNKEMDWDISTHRAKECQLMLEHREKNMHSRYPNFDGNYEQQVLDLTYQGKIVGTLTLGYYGPYAFDDIELELINSLNRLLVGIGIVLLIISAGFASYLAVNLIRPIRMVVGTAKKISCGNYGVQIDEQYKTREIAELVSTINEMSVQLQKKELQKRRLTADVAHELRTPLANLQSHMEAVIDEVWEPTPELFQGCCDEIKRLTSLVNRLKELTEYENNRVALEKQTFSVNHFFDTLLSAFSFTAMAKNIRFQVECEPTGAVCIADEEKIKQCMINLLSNAIRYTPIGGTVSLIFYENKSFFNFEVSDTGIGIPENDLSQIFERFYRVDSSRSQCTGGMGIGLSITKAIIDMHNGEITVRSVPNKGTTFCIMLPK
ncbi:sensor histidine kinase [Anaerotignum sp.]|uniref:sensor histidine kinase n=1 Tax=Anaerotignum sp. TaxID=2039241 RepID=UPI002896C1A2|nr:HAMP domain-containing sensor histidine kinase [Anaerotignum sp.]